MRKNHKRRLQNSTQNVVILCLIVSAFCLLLRTDLIHPEALDGIFSAVSSPNTSAQSGTLNTSQPIRIAVRSGGACSGWLNETTDGNIFENFAPLLTEALGSAENMEVVDAVEFRRALENDGIYYDFTVALPLSVLSQWLSSSDIDSRFSTRALLLSGLQDTTAALYAWDPETDTYYRWSTTVLTDTLLNNSAKYEGSPMEFSFLQDAPYNTLAPYTLLPQDRVSLYELSAKTVASEDADTILTALEFNVHSNTRYPESNGTEVVVQGLRTLRFVPDGTVLYNGGNDGVSLLSVEHRGDNASLHEHIDAAWRTANALLHEQIGAASLYLKYAAADHNGNAELRFGYMVNGYPVMFQDDYAAKFQIENNTITAFTLHLRNYTVSEKSCTLLPTLQAAAAARDDTARELFCGYFDDGSDALSPCWLRR